MICSNMSFPEVGTNLENFEPEERDGIENLNCIVASRSEQMGLNRNSIF